MWNFIKQRWFLAVLIIVLLVGIGWPERSDAVARLIPANAIVAAVTFMMALPLETSEFWKAIRRPGPAWLASIINSGLAPPLGWLVSRALPPELAAGVIVATTVPCTLATAAVWTRRAGGNDAVAFLVTMITNLGCFIVVPAWLWVLIGVRQDVDYIHIVKSLVLLVVLPIIVAQILRQWPALGRESTKHKHAISHLAQIGVLVIVFVGAANCGMQLKTIDDRSLLSARHLTVMIAGAALVHLALWLIGVALARGFGFDRNDAIAVGFSGSQKTLMVGAYLALAVGPLAILPMVAYHAAQLVIDTLIADRWRRGNIAPG
jgi:solute carrier family 10 (sodium/bile acid cotransporter), member 7